MKESIGYLFIGITLILSICLSGCVAPPAEQQVTPVDNYDPNQFASMETTNPSGSEYVTEVTPFITPYTRFIIRYTYHSRIPDFPRLTHGSRGLCCHIFAKRQPFAYNETAISFNLKNAPM